MKNQSEETQNLESLRQEIWDSLCEAKWGLIYLGKKSSVYARIVIVLNFITLSCSCIAIVTALSSMPWIGRYIPGVFAALAGVISILGIVGPWAKQKEQFVIAYSFAQLIDIEFDTLWRRIELSNDNFEELELQYNKLREQWELKVVGRIQPHKWDMVSIKESQDLANIQLIKYNGENQKRGDFVHAQEAS